MTLLQTTDEQKLHVYGIAVSMAHSLPAAFVVKCVELATVSRGIHDLMVLWREFADEPGAQEQVVADLQDAIDEAAERPPAEKPKVTYDQLEGVARRVVDFKANLRKKVERWGGISQLAKATGMPQPSLSRFFASASMPRKTTLYRMAQAMDLPEADIVFDWTV